MLKLGVLGFGAIGRAMLDALEASGTLDKVDVVAVLVRQAVAGRSLPNIMSDALVTQDFAPFMAQAPDLVVECAGHEIVRQVCPRVLQAGTSLILISIGALAERAIEHELRSAAESSGATLTLPAGAVGGLDLLAAARLVGLSRVQYISRKPPSAWRGSKAEEVTDLATLAQPHAFFTGTAREAALQFPQNANVAAAIALAGMGFDDTQVSLTADPAAARNEHIVLIDGAFGHAEMRISGVPLAHNPKSSWLAALSLARAVSNASARVVI